MWNETITSFMSSQSGKGLNGLAYRNQKQNCRPETSACKVPTMLGNDANSFFLLSPMIRACELVPLKGESAVTLSELETALQEARERQRHAVKAPAPKHKGGEVEEFDASGGGLIVFGFLSPPYGRT